MLLLLLLLLLSAGWKSLLLNIRGSWRLLEWTCLLLLLLLALHHHLLFIPLLMLQHLLLTLLWQHRALLLLLLTKHGLHLHAALLLLLLLLLLLQLLLLLRGHHVLKLLLMPSSCLSLLLCSLLLLVLVHLALLDECSHQLRIALQDVKDLLLLLWCVGRFQCLQKLLKSLLLQARSGHAGSGCWWSANNRGDGATNMTACQHVLLRLLQVLLRRLCLLLLDCLRCSLPKARILKCCIRDIPATRKYLSFQNYLLQHRTSIS